jgi:hypothetical protein
MQIYKDRANAAVRILRLVLRAKTHIMSRHWEQQKVARKKKKRQIARVLYFVLQEYQKLFTTPKARTRSNLEHITTMCSTSHARLSKSHKSRERGQERGSGWGRGIDQGWKWNGILYDSHNEKWVFVIS